LSPAERIEKAQTYIRDAITDLRSEPPANDVCALVNAFAESHLAVVSAILDGDVERGLGLLSNFDIAYQMLRPNR